jgi:hypothetical protein
MPAEDFIITVYVCIDDFMKQIGKLRSWGPSPKLSDSEVLTMEIVGEFLRFGSDKAIYDYFRTHWQSWFPNLGSCTTFVRQVSNFSTIKQKLWEHMRKQCRSNDLYLFDGFPIQTCNCSPKSEEKYALTPLRCSSEDPPLLIISFHEKTCTLRYQKN